MKNVIIYISLIIIAIISCTSIHLYSILKNEVLSIGEIVSNKSDQSTVDLKMEIKIEDEYIKWRYNSDGKWNNLIALSELKGKDGIDGEDGYNGNSGKDASNIELKVDGSILKWKYTDKSNWIELFDFNNLIEKSNHNPIILSVNGNSQDLGCIKGNVICNSGTVMSIQVGDTEAYNFYVISDDGENLELILAHNLGSPVTWSRQTNTKLGPNNLFIELLSRTSTWNKISPIEDYEYINAEETDEIGNEYLSLSIKNGIVSITSNNGVQSTINSENSEKLRARIISEEEAINLGCKRSSNTCPTWLSGNLLAENNSNTPYGYWTVTTHYTASSPSNAMSIHYNASIYSANASSSSTLGRGIRPIIKIDKYIK